jgi:hypothetical protein
VNDTKAFKKESYLRSNQTSLMCRVRMASLSANWEKNMLKRLISKNAT